MILTFFYFLVYQYGDCNHTNDTDKCNDERIPFHGYDFDISQVKINKPMPALKKYVPHNEFAFFQFSLLFMDKEVRIPE